MNLRDKVIVITGAASGIGAALAQRFAAEQPAAIVLSDLPAQAAALEAVAAGVREAQQDKIKVLIQPADVGVEAQVQALTEAALQAFGRIDLFCSNAGIIRDGDEHAPDSDWQLNFQIHVMAHVYAARAAVPAMKQAGGGYRDALVVCPGERVGRRPDYLAAVGHVCGQQACGHCPGRVPGHSARRRQYQGVGVVPAGGGDTDDRRAQWLKSCGE